MGRLAINKIKLTLILTLVASMCFFAAFYTFAKAEPIGDHLDELTTFEMDGADLIVEGNGGVNGINFTASMSSSQYEALVGLGYESVETGLFIMPDHYVKDAPLDQTTFFSSESIFDWAEWDEAKGSYVYSGNKTRIININANSWVQADNKYTYSGAIVDILEHNEEVCFVAVAYLKAEHQGEVFYKFTNSYGMSVSLAVAKAKQENTLTDNQLDWIDDNWPTAKKVSADYKEIDVTEKSQISVLDSVIIDDDLLPKSVYTGYNDSQIDVTLTDEKGVVCQTDGSGVVNFNDYENLKKWTLTIKIDGVALYEGEVKFYSTEVYRVKYQLSSMVGSNTVLCTYKGLSEYKDEFVKKGTKLSLSNAVPLARYSDSFKFDKWIYVNTKGQSITVTASTVFSESVFDTYEIVLIAQCKKTPYGPTIQ